MKNGFLNVRQFIYLVILGIILSGCSEEDDVPEIINEEEVITTMTVSLVPENGGETVVLNYQDLDGDGPNEPIVQGGTLASNTDYEASITLLNETVDPPENITTEVAEEGEAHQFFYSNTAGMVLAYADEDVNGNPIGIAFKLQTFEADSGSLTVILRHEPNKNAPGVIAGDITNAGGETDISVTFGVEVQ